MTKIWMAAAAVALAGGMAHAQEQTFISIGDRRGDRGVYPQAVRSARLVNGRSEHRHPLRLRIDRLVRLQHQRDPVGRARFGWRIGLAVPRLQRYSSRTPAPSRPLRACSLHPEPFTVVAGAEPTSPTPRTCRAARQHRHPRVGPARHDGNS